MKWNNITVGQFQEIYRLSIKGDMDDIDRLTKVICIIYNKTEAQVDDLTMLEFNRLGRQCKFLLTEEIPGKPKRTVRVGVKRYHIVYKPSKLRHRQYLEVNHFAKDPIGNLHYFLASLVMPLKWGFIKVKNEAEDHERLAEEMLNAPITTAYHCAVFFCKLYINLIQATRDSLVETMMKEGTTKEQAEELLNASMSAMVGLLPQKTSRLSRALQWIKSLSFQSSRS